MNVKLPGLAEAERLLVSGKKRAFIGAFGFEERALGWCQLQKRRKVLSHAFIFKYINPKGPNRIQELSEEISSLGATKINLFPYNTRNPQLIEQKTNKLRDLSEFDEIVVDVSAMTKVAILLVLHHLWNFPGDVRLVYSEAKDYCPSKEEYDPVKREMAASARFPSKGADKIIRLRCLNSIRMQGQPATVIAFASFNEALISQMLGSISPHRLMLINGRPPRSELAWREQATRDIHVRVLNEYASDNFSDTGDLLRTTSTLDYRQTFKALQDIYAQLGLFERIICGATGSKMQTVALALFKRIHPDIQVEYPTPDSYYVKDMTTGIRCVHEVKFKCFKEFGERLHEFQQSSATARA
jgi:hypothetical protein